MDGRWMEVATRLLCVTDSGTRGFMSSESSWLVGGIMTVISIPYFILFRLAWFIPMSSSIIWWSLSEIALLTIAYARN